MQERWACNPLIDSDDHTGISSVFIMHVIYKSVSLICRLSQSIPSSKLRMKVCQAEDLHEKSKNVITYYVYNHTSGNSTIVYLVYKTTFYGATY